MTDNVYVADGDNQADTATLLLAAAEELDLDPSVVQRYTGQHSGWQVPQEVADKAGLDTYDPYEDLNAEVDQARKDAEEVTDDVRKRDFLLPKGATLDASGVPIQGRDEEAAKAAVGGIETGPSDEAVQAKFAASEVDLNDASGESAKAVQDTTQTTTTRKTTTAKKAAAKKSASKAASTKGK